MRCYVSGLKCKFWHCTHTYAHTGCWNSFCTKKKKRLNFGAVIKMMKNSTRQTFENKKKEGCCVLQQRPLPSYPSIVWLNFSQEHIRLPLICKQTSSRLSIGWHNTSPSALDTKWLPQRRSAPAGEEGRRRGRRMKVRAEAEWRERVNSHVTGSSCSVDGMRERHNNLNKGW